MRGVALGALLTITALAMVGTATALAPRAAEPFDQTLTLAGGPEAATRLAYLDDPDAPIATARYGGERTHATPSAETFPTPAVATVALAGGPIQAAPVQVAPVQVAEAAPAESEAPARAKPAPEPRPAPRLYAEAKPAPRGPVLALTHAPYRPLPGKVLQARVDDEPLPFTPLGLQSDAVRRLTLNASNLMSRATASAQDLKRGRWLMYAASSGKAYGLNLIRDTFGGWRNAGVSEEKLARFGSRQVGVGYRKDNRQVSLTATQRKFRGIDYSDKDMVVGVTVSVRGK
ncbi:hypothetical protein [Caulobacter sp. RHG1]|uniref:hypothetical protein n=1 Tax=Caulobacter sp. (strain RHG1) TaxID=2545762 RepID=UPI001552C223|nr:hypothetical protein [Caulobacter sp. RHG1]NQE60461.1 hypothetical protein [Caulobacter sp. RHG1]